MSLKPVELQFVIHKNDQAGLKQHQLMQKPIQDQAVLSDAADKNTVKERQVSGKAEEADRAAVKDDGARQQGGQSRKRRTPEAASGDKKSPAASDHPYKGRHIDLSL
ncbi:hypothetical protein ACFQI7_04195 [Paenibacillus allorhizosphaerae]|uniref:Uncharacterized protein n=1 Tax=Paenibacillus allorhizosphaerae TaxID=2849866 RepID=A0ABM8VCM8_9BACL|nr:hypothetical protein [Paenibacillus allorhizosphaerae]CAG7623780.1 hypothetical protein PAECIP111802_00986 [Paenibacillus allorhizosphaerae]